jgi:hypothetical protein
MSKKELSSKISRKKSELAPIIKELKALRESIDVIIFLLNIIKILKYSILFRTCPESTKKKKSNMTK